MGAGLLLAGVLTACASPSGSIPVPSVSSLPTDSLAAEATIVIELVGNAPVFDGSLTGQEWVLPAALTWADGAYHLWGVTFDQQNSVEPRGFYASSLDGMAWTVADADPLAGIDLDLSLPGPVPGSVLHESDGSWVMFLWGIPAPQIRGADLFRATAPAPGGPWAADPQPILAGSASGWDSAGLEYPSVVHTDVGYHMLYSGSSMANRNELSVGIATSADGISWTKQPEPVIGPGLCGAFDARSITLPRLRQTDDGYLLFYNGLPDATTARASVGVAESADGVAWTCASRVPALTGDDIPESGGIHVIAVAATAPGPEVLVESLQGASSALWFGDAVPVD